MFRQPSNKRTLGRGDYGGRKALRTSTTSSLNMVATPWMEKNATTLKLPAQREHWFLSEQSILAEAAERDIMPFLDGSYHPKPMYPEVRIVRYGYQKQLDGLGAPMTDAHGETIYRENANGEKIPELDAEGNHRIENEYMHQVGFGDLELQDVLKLHH